MSAIAWFFLGCACGSFACFIGSIVLILAFPHETAEVVVEWFAKDKIEPNHFRDSTKMHMTVSDKK